MLSKSLIVSEGRGCFWHELACSSRCQLSSIFGDLSDSKMSSEALWKAGLFKVTPSLSSLATNLVHLANKKYKSCLLLENSKAQNVSLYLNRNYSLHYSLKGCRNFFLQNYLKAKTVFQILTG